MSLYEEKARPGHTVKVVSTEVGWWKGSRVPLVKIEHIGIHNKRAQTFYTVTPEKNFRRRYKPVDQSN